MKFSETTKTSKNSLSFISLPLTLAALFIGISISEYTHQRQYTPESVKKDADNDGSIKGMDKFFFDARKNQTTGKMDYVAMAAADVAERAMHHAKTTRSASAATTLPVFNWNSMGPTQTGGRTRAVLIDNQDPTHQTIFAGGVSGGIWKSTNGGSTWGNTFATVSYSQNDTMANINVSCIYQDVNGVIYIGTGEDFPGSEEAIGDGIFKSTDDGVTWNQLDSTKPTPINESTVAWAYVNRIAVRPDAPNTIYAATNLGIYISRDGGVRWRLGYKKGGVKIGGSGNYAAYDLKISNDGSVIVSGIGGGAEYTYLCYPQTNDSLFIVAPSTGIGHINGDASRIEYAIAPTDANRIYASEIAVDGSFCLSKYSGIYMTETAKTNEGYWYLIGPGGSTAFDPYVEPLTTDDQCVYDNAMGVSTANEGELLVGGTTLWGWTQSGATDTIGAWQPLDSYYGSIHPDMHAIVFDNLNPDVVYIGCDGGVYKSLDNASTWGAYNRNYNTTQYYTLCYSPYMQYDTVAVGNSTAVEGLGMGGGTQDNGSPYIKGTGNYPNDGNDLSGGDGAGSWVSFINPNIAYFCSDDGSLLREGNLGSLSQVTTAYTQTYGKCLGADIDSMYNAAAAVGDEAFTLPISMYENAYDTLNSDSVQFIATVNYKVGDTIYPNGINGTYPYIFKTAVSAGDTINVPDRVVSRLAVAFNGSYGLWINGQGASSGTVIWKPIGGPLSKPDAFNAPYPTTAITWTPDGDAIYVGTEGSSPNLFRFTNINKVQAANYCSGALWYKTNTSVTADDTTVHCTNITFSGTSNADILSIDVDPKNGENVLVTVGGYGGSSVKNVWYSKNAQSATTPTFTNVQGNLPPMPVYSAVLDVLDSAGNSIVGSAMVATEHGIYSTTNINANPVVWVKNNNGMANCLSYVLRQQTLPAWECNNASTMYLATYGRGIWSSTDLYPKISTSVPVVKDAVKVNSLNVYPNPMTTEGNIAFNLATTDNVTITIYDMQGRVVSKTDLGSQAAGSHIFPFATSGYRGGIYFATLTGTTFRDVQKFVVTK